LTHENVDFIYTYNKGKSPYLRETYRYTPLLAYILQLNILLGNQVVGKLIFVIFDLLCGYLIKKIIDQDKQSSNTQTAIALAFWFYNPITLAISSRGNAESLIAFLVLAFIFFLKRGDFVLAGVFYGLSIHFKIYPITYAFAVLFSLGDLSFRSAENSRPSIVNFIRNNLNLIKFGVSSVGVLGSLTLYFYFKCVTL
jgi:phosphatidylinositol glycan class M